MIEAIPRISALADRLRERIRLEGAITFHDWMAAALYDSNDGYYFRDDLTKWGREGDYRTSPERSSLFSGTFARYFAGLYEKLGKPDRWTIVEAGAGAGSFGYGLLQTLQVFYPEIYAATHYIIDELSSSSRSQAQGRLAHFSKHVEFKNLSNKLDDWEIETGIVFSNELLDAFPVHRVSMQHGALQEFYVSLDSAGEFQWSPGPLSTPRLQSYFEENDITLNDGDVTEVNLAIEDWLTAVVARLRCGYLVTVDYGFTTSPGLEPQPRAGTLRGFRRHQIVENILAQSGKQDLTTTVDWNFVKRAGERRGLEVVEFARQDKFLLAAGLLDQLQLEAERTESDADKLRLSTAAREMVLPDGMAASFQVLVQKITC